MRYDYLTFDCLGFLADSPPRRGVFDEVTPVLGDPERPPFPPFPTWPAWRAGSPERPLPTAAQPV